MDKNHEMKIGFIIKKRENNPVGHDILCVVFGKDKKEIGTQAERVVKDNKIDPYGVSVVIFNYSISNDLMVARDDGIRFVDCEG